MAERCDILVAAKAKADDRDKERFARTDRLFAAPDGDRDVFAALDQTTRDWRTKDVRATEVDRALDIAESGPGRSSQSNPRHTLVVDTEKAHPDTSSRNLRDLGSAFAGSDDIDREAHKITHRLADRVRVREIIAGRSEQPAAAGLVQQLVEWLRTQIVRLLDTLRRTADATPSRSRPVATSKTMSPAESPPGSAQRAVRRLIRRSLSRRQPEQGRSLATWSSERMPVGNVRQMRMSYPKVGRRRLVTDHAGGSRAGSNRIKGGRRNNGNLPDAGAKRRVDRTRSLRGWTSRRCESNQIEPEGTPFRVPGSLVRQRHHMA